MNSDTKINDCLVSVIIPCYRSDDTIAETVTALMEQEGSINYEIIVVNSSDDNTPAILQKQFPSVKLIQLQKQTLAGEARNTGVQHAKGKFIAFLDSDCIVNEDWLQNMLIHFSPVYSAVGGPIENANPEKAVSWAGYILEFSDFFSQKGITNMDHIPSGNLLLLKSVFTQSGGFVESFKYAQEDRLYSWKLRKSTGKKNLFHSNISVKHNHRITFKGFLNHQFNIGVGGAAILEYTDLRGSELIKKKLLTNLIIPLLPLKKTFLSVYRICKWHPSILIKQPLIIPLLIIGMCYWMFGFAAHVNRK